MNGSVEATNQMKTLNDYITDIYTHIHTQGDNQIILSLSSGVQMMHNIDPAVNSKKLNDNFCLVVFWSIIATPSLFSGYQALFPSITLTSTIECLENVTRRMVASGKKKQETPRTSRQKMSNNFAAS